MPLHQTDSYLQSGLFAEPEETDVVGLAHEAAGAVHAARLDGLAPDLGHDVALATQVLVAERQEVVDDKSYKQKQSFSIRPRFIFSQYIV